MRSHRAWANYDTHVFIVVRSLTTSQRRSQVRQQQVLSRVFMCHFLLT